MRLGVSIAAVAAGMALAASGAAQAAPVAHTPNLRESAPALVSTVKDTSSGQTQYELIFASGLENVGAGPMDVRGSRPDTTQSYMTVTQYVHNDTGPDTPYAVNGRMQYVTGNHNHWHYLGIEHYELRRVGDYSLVDGDHKTGFCLGDSSRVLSDADPAHYDWGFNNNCQQNTPTALSVQMGVDRGWRDIYDPQKEGQYVYVTGAPAGDYYLVMRVNEDHSLQETNYSDNASSALVHLSWPNGTSSTPAVTVLRTCAGFETCPLPVAQTGDASGITPTGATLNGTVNPNGDGTSYEFDYGSTSLYGTATARQTLDPGQSPVPVSASIGDLYPNVTYHYRVTAFEGGDVFNGGDRTFTTAPLPPGNTLPNSPIQPPKAQDPAFYVRSVHSLHGGRVALRLTLPAAGEALLRATSHGLGAASTTVGSGRRATRSRGTITVYIRPTRAGLALLRSRRQIAANLRVTFRPAGGAARALSLRVTLRR